MAPLRGWGRTAPNRIGAPWSFDGPDEGSRGFAKLKHLPQKAAPGPSKRGGDARLDLFSPGESGNGPASAGYASYENITL